VLAAHQFAFEIVAPDTLAAGISRRHFGLWPASALCASVRLIVTAFVIRAGGDLPGGSQNEKARVGSPVFALRLPHG
jgi:hypothetical protein